MARWQDCWYRTSFDPYSLDVDFLKRLAKFDDGRIRLRFSYDKRKWAVERKQLHNIEYTHNIPEFVKRFNPQTKTYHTVPNETYICARDGYFVVDYLPVEVPPKDWVIRNLEYHDIRRWGGGKEMARKIEQEEQRRADQQNKEQKDTWKHTASEVYDELKRKYGEQAFVPRNFERT